MKQSVTSKKLYGIDDPCMATQTMRFAMQTYVNPFVKSFDCPEMVLTRARPTPFTAITLKLPTNELKRFE